MSEGIRFGTGGWRAVIGEDFTAENVRRVARAIALMAIEDGAAEKPIPIGYDRRFLSDTAAKWIAEVLCASGINVLFLNRSAPTPLIMHTVKTRGYHFGIEVTASHNPPAYNGVKLIIREGRDAPVETTRRIECIASGLSGEDIPRIPFEEAVLRGLVSYIEKPFDPFIDDIIARLDMAAIRRRGLRIAFDPMHGSGTYPLMVILCTARCTLDIINQNKDAYFGAAMPAPTELTLRELSNKVVTGGYDLGIAFDGDGDRVGIIDENGRYVSANDILVMLYWYLCEYKGWQGPVVRNYSTTHRLDRIAESYGRKCYEVPVGFKHISAKIDETDAVLGGESSGGLTVRGHIYGKDSIYAASLFVEMLSVTGMTTGQIQQLLENRYGRLVDVDDSFSFTPEMKADITRAILEEHRLPDLEGVDHVGYDDGCKVYFKSGGFITCRFSGTEPLLRLMAEDTTRELAQAHINAFKDFIRSL